MCIIFSVFGGLIECLWFEVLSLYTLHTLLFLFLRVERAYLGRLVVHCVGSDAKVSAQKLVLAPQIIPFLCQLHHLLV